MPKHTLPSVVKQFPIQQLLWVRRYRTLMQCNTQQLLWITGNRQCMTCGCSLNPRCHQGTW
jgi:hypothetical protein